MCMKVASVIRSIRIGRTITGGHNVDSGASRLYKQKQQSGFISAACKKEKHSDCYSLKCECKVCH